MNIFIIGASKGLGLELVNQLNETNNHIFAVSRTFPSPEGDKAKGKVTWINADMSEPQKAVAKLKQDLPKVIDVFIYNLGIWESNAFSKDYNFLDVSDEELVNIINTNTISTILLLKGVMQNILASTKPRIILIGSTSALRGNGRPEVAFGASKQALNGISDSLRESFRSNKLGVSCLHLGYLNKNNEKHELDYIPLSDVVEVVKTLLKLSSKSFIKEVSMPAISDERF